MVIDFVEVKMVEIDQICEECMYWECEIWQEPCRMCMELRAEQIRKIDEEVE